MGTRSYYTRMYGVHIEREVEPGRLVAFLRRHLVSLNLHTDDLHLAEHDPDYIEEYEGASSENGAAALLADAINEENEDVHVEGMWSYDDPNPYLGICAESLLPWDERSALRATIGKEELESLIRGYVEALYGTCPEFGDYEVEQYG